MAEVTATKARPKHLNLMQIRMPLPAYVSILHRVSGAGLFLFLGGLIWLLDASLGSPEQYAAFTGVIGFTLAGIPIVKLILLGLLWSFLHHFCAGIRFLLLDLHVGIELASARASAFAVFGVSLVMTLVLGGALW